MPLRDPRGLGPPHARPAVRVRRRRRERGLQVIIAGRRRRGPPAGHDRREDAPAGAGRARRVEGAQGHGLAALDRPDAGGRPVGTLAIGRAGAVNAALLAASIVALGDAAPPRTRCSEYRATQTRDRARASRPVGHDAARDARRHPRRRAARPHAGAGRLSARDRAAPPGPGRGFAGLAGGAGDRRRLRRPRARSRELAAGVDVVDLRVRERPGRCGRGSLEARVPVFPPPAALEAAQDRLAEKQLFRRGRPRRCRRSRRSTFADALATRDRPASALPAVLKTRRLGYDGKGQAVIHDAAMRRGRVARARRGARDPRSVRAVRPRAVDRWPCAAATGRSRPIRWWRTTTATGSCDSRWRRRPTSPPRLQTAAERHARTRDGRARLRRRAGDRAVRASGSGCSRTRWPLACTTAATGRSRAPRPASSRSISARSWGCRWARPNPSA